MLFKLLHMSFKQMAEDHLDKTKHGKFRVEILSYAVLIDSKRLAK